MELEETKLMNAIRGALKRDSTMIPRFIDNTTHIDKECYEIGVQIIQQLIPLVAYRVASKGTLRKASENINFLFDDMIKISPDISILYYEYIVELMTSYGNLFIANEMFESKVNFDNLKNIIDGKI